MSSITPEDINALLPQTQCGLCGYGGCLPYAEAIVFEKAQINLCPPGGIDTLKSVAEKLNQDPAPFIPEMEEKAKQMMVAKIREDQCIGCTKCIKACPVDAIIGGAKQMHVVLTADCTGCELCIPPCPVDCIDLITLAPTNNWSKQIRDRNRLKYQKKLARQSKEKQNAAQQKNNIDQSTFNKKSYIEAAIARAKAKKQVQR